MKHFEIIARYDEVICEKAPKHAILELQQKIDERGQEIVRSAAVFSKFAAESEDRFCAMIKEINDNHTALLNSEEKIR